MYYIIELTRTKKTKKNGRLQIPNCTAPYNQCRSNIQQHHTFNFMMFCAPVLFHAAELVLVAMPSSSSTPNCFLFLGRFFFSFSLS